MPAATRSWCQCRARRQQAREGSARGRRPVLSQEQLAAFSDLNRSYVGEIERGRVIVSIVTVHKLASALQLDAAALLTRSAQITQMRQARGLQLAAIGG